MACSVWANDNVSASFITGTTKGEVQNLTEEETVNIFLPTTPNPTSGFLLFVPKSDVVPLGMSVEEAVKMVISGGIVTPPDRRPKREQNISRVSSRTFEDLEVTKLFHQDLKVNCDRYDNSYYPKFKNWCDEYFFLPHRNEARGVGGIFFDYLYNDDWERDFSFIKDIGKTFLSSYSKIVKNKVEKKFSKQDRQDQLIKRGRYVEFNLLYDRGTKFGLNSGGNIDSILMSLPPEAKWE